MNADLASYNKQGFLILKNFFDKNLVNGILKEAKMIFFRQFSAKGYTSETFEKTTEKEFNEMLYRLFREDIKCLSNCGKQVQHMVSLHRLSLDEKIMKLLGELGLQHPSVSTRPVLYFNHEKLAQKKVFHTVEAHQDWRSMQGSLNAVVVWVPLIDIDKSLGALEVIPGSHLSGLRTDHIDNGFGMVKKSSEDESGMISVELEQGDILVFSSFLIHESGENSTDSPRWSCHFRYNDLAEPTFIQRGYPHAYIYKPVDELMTPDFPAESDIKKIFR